MKQVICLENLEAERRTPTAGYPTILCESMSAAKRRGEVLPLAYSEGGYTRSALAALLGLSVSRISRVIRAAEANGKT